MKGLCEEPYAGKPHVRFCEGEQYLLRKLSTRLDTVGKNAKKIEEYIRNQIKEDQISDQLTLKEYNNPFTGGK